ncbi:MAG: hypothetical protein JST00_24480 [Deltaproteobacteria bacterium]|nr:hypothetical protein [Deltaproteobacteria bacterium]
MTCPAAAPRLLALRELATSKAFLVAVAIVAINDHVLKGAGILPSVVTGKLSDLAGLFFAPTLLAALVTSRTRRAAWICDLATASVFAAIKLAPWATGAWNALVFGTSVCDPTDCLALPMIVLGRLTWPLAPRAATPAPDAGRASLRPLTAVVAVAALAVCAGSSPHMITPSTITASKWTERGTPRLSVDPSLSSVALTVSFATSRLDCEALVRAPAETLRELRFEQAASGFATGDVPLDPDRYLTSPPWCGIAKIEATESRVLGIGADSLPPTFVVWRRDAVRTARLNDPNGAARVVIAPGKGELVARATDPVVVFSENNVPASLSSVGSAPARSMPAAHDE